MAVDVQNFTTGPSVLPDIGELSYNGCVFSCLFSTEVSGVMVKDEAVRTVKYMEYTIKVDGYVTLPGGDDDVAPVMFTLRNLLSEQGGQLVYMGRGFDLTVNVPGGVGVRDVAWGPVPEILNFTPMGGGRSALVQWQVKVRIPETASTLPAGFGIPMLQFNYDTVVAYGEDGFSTLSINGTLEIPLTRRPTQATRTLTQTADDLRRVVETRVLSGIDLGKFRITRREFPLSRDKRTLTWNVQAEERPYMDMPPDCTVARGTYSVRPAQTGAGLCNWLCTLRCTYTVRADRPRRTAWLAFLMLFRLRIGQARKANILNIKDKDQNPDRKDEPERKSIFKIPIQEALKSLGYLKKEGERQNKKVAASVGGIPVDFNIDEGIYLDSKTITFSMTWRLVTTFDQIMLASGVWRKLNDRVSVGAVGPQEQDATSPNLWAVSMQDVQGAKSWLDNRVNPALDVIVDFGGG